MMNYLIYGRAEPSRGKATQGNARQRKATQGKARQGKARQGKARQGKARQGNARQGNARQESTSFGRSIKTDCSCHRVGGWVAVKSGSLSRKAGSKQCQDSLDSTTVADGK